MPLTISERRQIKEEKLLCDIYRDLLRRCKYSGEVSEWEQTILDQISDLMPGACKGIDRQVLGE